VSEYFTVLLPIIGVGVGWFLKSYLESYLGEKGKNLATKEDIDRIVRTTEEIKAEIGSTAWLKQKRWDRKWDCYVEVVKNLSEVHALIRESIELDPRRPGYAHQLEDTKHKAGEAFLKFRQFGSIARIAVAPSVRTVLTCLGHEWNKARGTAEGLEIVARWGWLVVSDIARNDLFGEPREMSDEFVGDVGVSQHQPGERRS
jgi:hypothetical protein